MKEKKKTGAWSVVKLTFLVLLTYQIYWCNIQPEPEPICNSHPSRASCTEPPFIYYHHMAIGLWDQCICKNRWGEWVSWWVVAGPQYDWVRALFHYWEEQGRREEEQMARDRRWR